MPVTPARLSATPILEMTAYSRDAQIISPSTTTKPRAR